MIFLLLGLSTKLLTFKERWGGQERRYWGKKLSNSLSVKALVE